MVNHKPGQIPVEALDAETAKKLGIKIRLGDTPVEPRIVALGKVFQDLGGLTNREAMWVLRNAYFYIQRHKGRIKRENRGVARKPQKL